MKQGGVGCQPPPHSLQYNPARREAIGLAVILERLCYCKQASLFHCGSGPAHVPSAHLKVIWSFSGQFPDRPKLPSSSPCISPCVRFFSGLRSTLGFHNQWGVEADEWIPWCSYSLMETSILGVFHPDPRKACKTINCVSGNAPLMFLLFAFLPSLSLPTPYPLGMTSQIN